MDRCERCGWSVGEWMAWRYFVAGEVMQSIADGRGVSKVAVHHRLRRWADGNLGVRGVRLTSLRGKFPDGLPGVDGGYGGGG